MRGAGTRRRVLVTDDDPLLRWALSARLEELGLEVIEAGTVQRTLEREGEADLVILDVRLPDGNGLDAASRILARRPQRPLLLMTAFATPELAAEAARAGVRHCIEKPFDMDVVARIVDDALQG
jgi:DNA-binding NtrC family response regulator